MSLRTATILAALLAAAVGAVMVSNESVWIDEVQTFRFARHETFSGWFNELVTCKRSQAQMPLGMFAAWVGAKVFGLREWQLRAVNIVWLALAAYPAVQIGRRARSPVFVLLLMLSPFVAFYLNEARPYVMLICIGTWLLYFTWRVREGDLGCSAVAGFCVSATAGFATHALFGVVVFAAAIISLAAAWRGRLQLRGQQLATIALTAALLTGLTAYYAWTVRQGAAGARLWSVGLGNVFYTVYELLGFGGLGPPRSELREMARNAGALKHVITGPANIGLGILALLYGCLVFNIRRLGRSDCRAATTVLVLSLAVLSGAGFVLHFPFWGRHAAGVLPFAMLIIALLIQSDTSERFPRLIGCALVLCFAASGIRQRFDPAYGKEDYRSMCRVASMARAEGLSVWWVADPEVADYFYRVPLSPAGGNGTVAPLVSVSRPVLEKMSSPHVVLISKPDIHDDQDAVREYVHQHALVEAGTARGFTIWSAPQASARVRELVTVAKQR